MELKMSYDKSGTIDSNQSWCYTTSCWLQSDHTSTKQQAYKNYLKQEILIFVEFT